MKHEYVDIFEKLKAQLDGLHQEMSLLSRKSPKDAVNTFKLKFINSMLKECNSFFGVNYRPLAEFETFSPEELPSNSDVTFIVSQYIECAEKFRADNIEQVSHNYWVWKTQGTQNKIRTSPPKKLINK
jgi:hypothetical protein